MADSPSARCAVFTGRRSPYGPAKKMTHSPWCQHRSAPWLSSRRIFIGRPGASIGWVKTTRTNRNPSDSFSRSPVLSLAHAYGGWRRLTGPRAGAPSATASRPRRGSSPPPFLSLLSFIFHPPHPLLATKHSDEGVRCLC
jgi:hypothetical protein